MARPSRQAGSINPLVRPQPQQEFVVPLQTPTTRSLTYRRWIALFTLAAAFLLAASPRTVLAQAVPTATGPGPYISVGGTIAAYKTNYGERTIAGYSIYMDLHPHKTYGVEIQAQTLPLHQQYDMRQSTLLVGPRISYGSGRLTPFVKVLVGMGRFEFPYRYAKGNYFVLAPGIGADFALNRRFKVRLLQVEYQTWPQFTYGTLNNYGVSSGVSIRIF